MQRAHLSKPSDNEGQVEVMVMMMKTMLEMHGENTDNGDEDKK